MSKKTHFLTEIRREELETSVFSEGDQVALEMMRAHFDSHPTMPGEKAFKKRVNELLDNPDMLKDWDPDDAERKQMASMYAETRIRETKFIGPNVADQSFPLTHLTQYTSAENPIPVQVYKIDANICKVDDGVAVYVKDSLDKYQKIGYLPDTFITNNPLIAGSCMAEISIEDYSNGKLKNVSERVVVDTDGMGGNSVVLTDDMLSGLDTSPEVRREPSKNEDVELTADMLKDLDMEYDMEYGLEH